MFKWMPIVAGIHKDDFFLSLALFACLGHLFFCSGVGGHEREASSHNPTDRLTRASVPPGAPVNKISTRGCALLVVSTPNKV
jgi:hypothetical protein